MEELDIPDQAKIGLGIGAFLAQAVGYLVAAYALECLINSFMAYWQYGFHVGYLQSLGVLYFLPRLLGRKS